MLVSLLKKRSAGKEPLSRNRIRIKVGIPKVLNIWSTHRFWIGFLKALGIPANNIVFSSDTSEEQYREFGKGRIGMDSCYPVKCMAGHIGELLTTKELDVILLPMIYSLPSFLKGHVMDTLSCTRVPMGVENIKAGFMKEENEFEKRGVKLVTPFVSFGEPHLLPQQLYESLKDVLDVTYKEVEKAAKEGLEELKRFDQKMRKKTREILEWCARNNHPCILVLARPYHMDPGIGHEIDAELQSLGYPTVWCQYLPVDDDLMGWLFGPDVEAGLIKSPFDISDVWTSSYSSNTNEIIWAAKFASRFPWITAVIRLSSYECGMDQPTYTPTQKIVEASGTLYFKFGDLDETKPSGSIRIRVETIDFYVKRYSPQIIERKLKRLGAGRSPLPLISSLERVPTFPSS